MTYSSIYNMIGFNNEVDRLKAQVKLGWEKEFRTLKWLGLRDGMKILDVGAGPGAYTELLLENLPNSKITALEIDKNQFKVLFNIGVVLNKLKRKEEAKKYYKKSIKSNDTYPYSYLNLALLYKDEDIEETIRILSLGIENNPGEAFLYYNRGCHFLKNNEVENAIKDIRRM